jgi:dTDP-glucose pyrophosphorylase
MAVDAALLLPPRASVREALETITKNSRQAVLVVDDGRLAGLVTDGDVRRAILRGVSLDERVSSVMNVRPVTIPPGTGREAALAIMQRRSIRHLPVVDAGGRLLDVVLLDELLRPATLPNAAVLMAGGEGSRLRPLTDALPKPLLRVGGKPLLEILVERLRAAGVRDFWMSVRYKSEMIEQRFGDGSALGVRIRYVREQEPLGTAGSLRLLEPLSHDPFFLVNGDVLTKCDFRALLAFHEREGADLTVGTVPYTVELPYGIVDVIDTRLTGVTEKPRLDFTINAGVYVVQPSVIALIPGGGLFDVPDVLRLLLAAGRRVAAYPIREYWLDVGHHDDFHKADRDVAEGLLD